MSSRWPTTPNPMAHEAHKDAAFTKKLTTTWRLPRRRSLKLSRKCMVCRSFPQGTARIDVSTQCVHITHHYLQSTTREQLETLKNIWFVEASRKAQAESTDVMVSTHSAILYGVVSGVGADLLRHCLGYSEAPTIAGIANQNSGTPVHLGTPVTGKTPVMMASKTVWLMGRCAQAARKLRASSA